jgi:putative ABC transport system permease protein
VPQRGRSQQVSYAAMTFVLAFRNLIHDRIRLAVTLIGILFSIVLVAVQLGLYLGARNLITSMIDRANADLWIMAYGTKNFEEAQLIDLREKFAALSVPGVAKAVPMIVAFNDWRKPIGGSTIVVIIGADAEDGGLQPWNIVEGDVTGLGARDAVIIEKTLETSA